MNTFDILTWIQIYSILHSLNIKQTMNGHSQEVLDLQEKLEREEELNEQKESDRMDREDHGFDKHILTRDFRQFVNNAIKTGIRGSYGPHESHNPRLLMSGYEIDPIEQVYTNEANILKIQNNW